MNETCPVQTSGTRYSVMDDGLRLWDLEDSAEFTVFHADAAIQCCAVSQDGKRTVAGRIRHAQTWEHSERNAVGS